MLLDAAADARRLRIARGFAIAGDELDVAERKKKRVRRFTMAGKKVGTFIRDLPDMPEFLVHIPDRGPVGDIAAG